MSNRFLRLAVVFFILGVALGIVMAASHDYTFRPLHAHLNLLGWVSMLLFGLFYRAIPAAAESTLAKAHFWIYVPAVVVQMATLALFIGGNPAIEPVLALASVAVGVAVLCFAVVVWKHTGRAA